MHKYYVELDGVSIIMSNELIEKNDNLRLNEDGELNFYKVRSKKRNNLSLRLMKTLKNTEEGVRYESSEKELFFENRLSKNQMIEVGGYLYKVIDIEKKTNVLNLEALSRKSVRAVYGAYESKAHEGLDIHDRENGSYLAEKYFYSKSEAIGYVMQERSKGRKVSL